MKYLTIGLLFFGVAMLVISYLITPLAMHYRCKEIGAVAVMGLARWHCVKEMK